MFNKVYLSRAQTRAMSIDHPIGDPFGGAAYGELRDPVTAAISAGGSILGSLVGGAASKSAANTQADAAQQGIEAQTQAKNDQIAALTASLDKQLAATGGAMTPELQNAYDYVAQIKDSIAGYGTNAGNVAAQTRNDQLNLASGVLNNRTDTAGNVYQQQQNWMNPVYQAGMAGQGQLMNYLGLGANTGQAGFGKYATAEFTPDQFYANQDPGYGFRMSEGLKAVDRQAAARNGLISGSALKASQRFGQDMASQEYGNAFSRYQTIRNNTLSPLQQLTAQGQSAAGSLGQYAGSYGQMLDNAYSGYGSTVNGILGNYGTTMGGVYGNQTNMLNGALGTSAGMINNTYANNANLNGAAYGTYGNNIAGVQGSYGTNLSNLYGAQGQANASGTVGAANALTGGITNANNSLYQNQLLNYLNPDKPGLAGTTYQGWGGSNASSSYANPYDYNMGVKGFTANGAYG